MSDSKSKSKSYSTTKNLIAGGIAGGIEACIMFPTEFIKTQLQLQSKALKKDPKAGPRYTGIIDCAVKTYKEKGILGFYRGLSSLVVGSIPKAALRFGAYEKISSLLKDEKGKLTDGKRVLSGLGAGIVESIFAVTPMETVKTQLISDQNSAKPRYKGLVHGVSCMLREQGIRGIYKGIVPTTFKQGCNQAVRFTVYENVANLMKRQKGDSKQLKAWESTLAGGIAGFVSVYVTMPFDVIKTQVQGVDSARYKSSVDCFLQILTHDGPLAFWKGTVPRLSRVMCSSAIIFATQNEIMKVFNVIFPEPNIKK